MMYYILMFFIPILCIRFALYKNEECRKNWHQKCADENVNLFRYYFNRMHYRNYINGWYLLEYNIEESKAIFFILEIIFLFLTGNFDGNCHILQYFCRFIIALGTLCILKWKITIITYLGALLISKLEKKSIKQIKQWEVEKFLRDKMDFVVNKIKKYCELLISIIVFHKIKNNDIKLIV